MNKYMKYLAIVAVAAMGFSAQANAASVSVNLGGVSFAICDGKGAVVHHRVVHDLHNRRHVDRCRSCRHEMARVEAARREAARREALRRESARRSAMARVHRH